MIIMIKNNFFLFLFKTIYIKKLSYIVPDIDEIIFDQKLSFQ